MERRCARVSADDSGIMFSSCGGSPYISLNTHRTKGGTKHPKSLWNRTRPDECHVYCTAENRDWTDKSTGNRWATATRSEESMGTRGERLAFFYKPSFEHGPWHGFPVGGPNGLKQYGRPPDYIVQSWYDEGLITYATYARITKGRF